MCFNEKYVEKCIEFGLFEIMKIQEILINKFPILESM